MTIYNREPDGRLDTPVDDEVTTVRPVSLPEHTNIIEGSSHAPSGSAFSLDLVGDVKVALDVMLGTASTTVGELMALAQGTVITLDRQVGEAIDVCLHGKVICRAEIIAIGEQFGIRVTEVVKEANATA
ncbi:FliM/FliN family flagellar motor switch protein [Paraburkholderia sp. J10-1]|uniref:FliM/FliN family flagellar motor switch protein n=1 Tax=Paraburkholderia sp. J10-1 TaxID=2805430 RepID=UPI002AB7504D|nr:FliM/FliN family flagellar motor switch protein [Paraburkholderia sp. J10-1]